MAQIVVNNLDPLLIAKLTSRSQRHHRSLNDELIAILENAVHAEGINSTLSTSSTSASAEKLDRARARYSNRIFDDSSMLVREDRER